jgi:hypothetical protein
MKILYINSKKLKIENHEVKQTDPLLGSFPPPYPYTCRHFIWGYFRFLQVLRHIYINIIICLLCVFAGSFSFCFILLVFNYLYYFLHILRLLFYSFSVICKDMIFRYSYFVRNCQFYTYFSHFCSTF